MKYTKTRTPPIKLSVFRLEEIFEFYLCLTKVLCDKVDIIFYRRKILILIGCLVECHSFRLFTA